MKYDSIGMFEKLFNSKVMSAFILLKQSDVIFLAITPSLLNSRPHPHIHLSFLITWYSISVLRHLLRTSLLHLHLICAPGLHHLPATFSMSLLISASPQTLNLRAELICYILPLWETGLLFPRPSYIWPLLVIIPFIKKKLVFGSILILVWEVNNTNIGDQTLFGIATAKADHG